MRVLILLMTLIAPIMVAAQTLPAYQNTYVNDYADIISTTDEAEITQQLQDLRAKEGIEMTVLTLRSKDDFGYTDRYDTIEKFATDIFNDWGIGDAQRNDGILVLVMHDDREMRIELGAGYGRDWDRAASDAVTRGFLPFFQEDRYSEGIRNGVRDTIDIIALPFTDGGTAPTNSGFKALVTFLGFSAVIALVALRRRVGDFLGTLRKCPHCHKRGLVIRRETTMPATEIHRGHGIRRRSCQKCGFESTESFTTPARKSKKRGVSSNGSFGGGRSGGGGASGRW